MNELDIKTPRATIYLNTEISKQKSCSFDLAEEVMPEVMSAETALIK